MNSKENIQPFFSVIICTYNRATLLPRALDSLLRQECQDFELIIIDDGSTDNTSSVIDSYSNQFENFRYIYQENQGLPKARNKGVSFANGKFITFLDSDDEFNPLHLKCRMEILLDNPEIDFLHGGVQVIGYEFVPDMLNPDSLIHIKDCIVGGTFFFTKSIFDKVDGFKSLTYGDDTDFFWRAEEIGAIIIKTNLETYIYHRDSEDSICNQLLTK